MYIVLYNVHYTVNKYLTKYVYCICFSTCFLVGPLAQLEKMFAKTRIIASIG